MDLQTFKQAVRPIYHNWTYLSPEDMRNKAELWYEHLNNYTEDEVTKAVQRILRKDEHPPTVTRFLELMGNATAAHQKYLPAGEPDIDPETMKFQKAIIRTMKWRFELAGVTKQKHKYGTKEYREDCMVNEFEYRTKINSICADYDEKKHFTDRECTEQHIRKEYEPKLEAK